MSEALKVLLAADTGNVTAVAEANIINDLPISVLHDPLSAGVCINPDYVKTKKYFVEVETAGKFTRGMTVIDKRIRAPFSPDVDVAVDVKLSDFVNDFTESLLWWAQENDGRF